MAAAQKILLNADTNRPLGTRPAKRMRAEGKIPAVMYGKGVDPTPFALEWADLRAALTTDAGMNALITIDVAGTEQLTIVKEMQRHPVRRDVLHVDFIAIDRNKPLHVDVRITLTDTDGHNLDGLVLDQQIFMLAISAKPDAIPNEIVVSCAELSLDEPIRAGDLTLPEGVELNIDPEDAIATANVPQRIVEPEVEAAAAEGEDGEGTEASAADSDGDAGGDEGGDEG